MEFYQYLENTLGQDGLIMVSSFAAGLLFTNYKIFLLVVAAGLFIYFYNPELGTSIIDFSLIQTQNFIDALISLADNVT